MFQDGCPRNEADYSLDLCVAGCARASVRRQRGRNRGEIESENRFLHYREEIVDRDEAPQYG
jgi:hypothetical protein